MTAHDAYRHAHESACGWGWDALSTAIVRELAERITGVDYTHAGPDDLPDPDDLPGEWEDGAPLTQEESTTPEEVHYDPGRQPWRP